MVKADIHSMTVSERDAVRSIYSEVYKEIFHEKPPDFDKAVREEEIHVACCCMKADCVKGSKVPGDREYACEESGETEIAGFLSIWKPGRYIHFLFISEKFRGLGIGRQLTAYAAEKYGCPLSLRCRENNKAALRFYRSDGWEVQLHGHSARGGWYLLRKGQVQNH